MKTLLEIKTSKKVFVFAARGGNYLGSPLDTETAYVRQFLGFLGMHDVSFVYAEGLNLGEPQRASAIEAARDSVNGLTV